MWFWHCAERSVVLKNDSKIRTYEAYRLIGQVSGTAVAEPSNILQTMDLSMGWGKKTATQNNINKQFATYQSNSFKASQHYIKLDQQGSSYFESWKC